MWIVDKGAYDDVQLDGLALCVFANWPGAIHEGDGVAVALIDENANEEQRAALTKLVRGEDGGPWAIFINTYALDGPRPVRFFVELDEHTSKLSVPGAVRARDGADRQPGDRQGGAPGDAPARRASYSKRAITRRRPCSPCRTARCRTTTRGGTPSTRPSRTPARHGGHARDASLGRALRRAHARRRRRGDRRRPRVPRPARRDLVRGRLPRPADVPARARRRRCSRSSPRRASRARSSTRRREGSPGRSTRSPAGSRRCRAAVRPTTSCVITSGAIEALELVGKSFLDRGDVVVVEGPTYLGAIMAFRSFEAERRRGPAGRARARGRRARAAARRRAAPEARLHDSGPPEPGGSQSLAPSGASCWSSSRAVTAS